MLTGYPHFNFFTDRVIRLVLFPGLLCCRPELQTRIFHFLQTRVFRFCRPESLFPDCYAADQSGSCRWRQIQLQNALIWAPFYPQITDAVSDACANFQPISRHWVYRTSPEGRVHSACCCAAPGQDIDLNKKCLLFLSPFERSNVWKQRPYEK